MHGDHPLERAKPLDLTGGVAVLRDGMNKPSARPRKGERVLNWKYLVKEDDRLDLIRSLDWPSPLARRLSLYLLERLDQQSGAILDAWYRCLYHGRKRRRGVQWLDQAYARVAHTLGEVLGEEAAPDSPARVRRQELLDQFPPQWNLYEPWEALVRWLVDHQHPRAQQVIHTLGEQTFPRTLKVSGYLPGEGSQRFIRFLMGQSDERQRRAWMPLFLTLAKGRLIQPKLHPWQQYGFAVLFERTLGDVLLERFIEQLDGMVDLDEADWVAAGQGVVGLFEACEQEGWSGKTCLDFMVAWLDREGPWEALGLGADHPVRMAMADHPVLRKAALMGRLCEGEHVGGDDRRAM